MNKTAKKEVEISFNYVKLSCIALLILFFLTINAYSSTATISWANRDFDCNDVINDDGGQINCGWNISGLDSAAENIVIYRRIQDGSLSQIATLLKEDTGYTDSSTVDGIAYTYMIKAINSSGPPDGESSAAYSTNESEDNLVPEPPTSIVAVDTPNDQGGSITISWSASSTEAQGAGWNIVKGYLINSSCTNLPSSSADLSELDVGLTYIYPYLFDTTTKPLEKGTCIFRMAAYDGGLTGGGTDGGKRNGTWSEWTTTIVNASDNIPPLQPTGAAAGDIIGDFGALGIQINWSGSIDESNIEGGASDILGYYILAATSESGNNWTNITVSDYHLADGGPYLISLQNGSNANTIGSNSPPFNVFSYFNTTMFYFKIKAYDGTFESQATSIVSAAFNGKPYVADEIVYLDPPLTYAQTEDDIYCTAFVCDPNNDEVTSYYKFTVAAFAGGINYEDEGDATCINLGPVQPGNPPPQYPNLGDIHCVPGIVPNSNSELYPDLWECSAVLGSGFTFKGNKITCFQTPNDGKENGDTVTSAETSQYYAINNTAPTATNTHIFPLIPLGNDTLTCDYTFGDIDLDDEGNLSINEKTTSFKWYINNEGFIDNKFVIVPDENGSTLDNYFDQNDKVMCAVNVCDTDQSWVSNSLCYNERSWYNSSAVIGTINATAASITGTETSTFDTSSNNALSITYTNSTEGSEMCTVTFSSNSTLTITEAIINITGSPGHCNLTATNTGGKLKLNTTTTGAGTMILLSGSAASEFGLSTNTHSGEDAYDLLGAWTWLNGSSYYEYKNSTITTIGGNSIPQITEYEDDSNASNPTNVGNEVTFDATWLDIDYNELAKIMVCDKESGLDNYGCQDDYSDCSEDIIFGDNADFAWVYTNQTGLMIDTIEIRIRNATINGTPYTTEGDTTPFIFSLIAYESDNITSTVPPTSSLPDYYDPQKMIIARSDWNSFTVKKWIKFSMQYNAQPLSDKYTGLKLCMADPNSPAFAGMELGGVGYAVRTVEHTDNWLMNIINWFGKLFRSVFRFTGYVTISGYLDNCLDINHPTYGDSKVWVGANNASTGVAWDNSEWYDLVDIRINYRSSGSNGSCPGTKTYCETEFSPETSQSCTYSAVNNDNTTVNYNIRACDDEGACSIWRQGDFSVNHAATIDWATIRTNYLSYEEGLTFTQDVNDDWNLQCVRGPASDKDIDSSLTSDVIIDADGFNTVFADIRNNRDPNLINNSNLKDCQNDSNLTYIDVNSNAMYDYEIDTLFHGDDILLQFSDNTSGTKIAFTIDSGCYFHSSNISYENGEDIIWDDTSSNLKFDEPINVTYEWFVKPFGDTEFKSCSDFSWCDNDYNDIVTHGNTMPGDEWFCQISPTDWRNLGVKYNSSIIHITGAVGEEVPETAGGPKIESVVDNSDNNTPINIDDEISINVTWSGPYDLVRLYVCDNSTHIRNSGCWNYEFFRNTNATMNNPVQAIFEVDDSAVYPGSDKKVFNISPSHGPIEYNLLLCSADYQCTNQSNFKFYVNHIPEVTEAKLLHDNGSEYIGGDTAKDSQTLKCTNLTYNDSDDALTNFTYRWWLFQSGYWQVYWEYGPTTNTSDFLSFSATELGDQWKCEVIPEDKYSQGISKETSIVTISESDSTGSGVSIINVTDNSNYTYPTNVGDDVIFTTSWTSPDTTGIKIYICDNQNILQTGCYPGDLGDNGEFVYSEWSITNPFTVTYTAKDTDYGNGTGIINYHVMACNDNVPNECSEVYNSNDAPNIDFSVNHIPTSENVTLKNETNGQAINENNSITCNYTFSDLDNSEYNEVEKNTSKYYTENKSYFSWYKKVQGVWVTQNYNLQELDSQYISYGDQWKCGVIVSDGYANSTESESGHIVVGSNAPLIYSLTHNSNSTGPVTFNGNLSFIVDWFDPQQEANGLIQLFVCNSTSTSGAGCSEEAYCNVQFTDSDPIVCDFNTTTITNSSSNITSFVYNLTIFDQTGLGASQNGTMYVNRKPTMVDVDLAKSTGGDNPTQNDNLVCNVSSDDADNSSLTFYNYTWHLDTGFGYVQYDYPNNETLINSHTSIGQRWKCEVKVHDGFIYSDSLESNSVTITQYGVNSTPTILSFSADSNSTNPTNVGDDVIFTINWTDAEQPFGEVVDVYICNSTNIIENGGCVDKSFSFIDSSLDNPIYSTYTVLETDDATINFTVMVCDDSTLCSTPNTSNFSVNHIPTADNVDVINLTGGSFFNTTDNLNCEYTFTDNDFPWKNATVTGIENETFDTTNNYTLNIDYTKEGVAESCSATFTRSGTTNINTIISNITSSCNITATNSSGYLKLTTQGIGADEYINITGGNASGVLGLDIGITYGKHTSSYYGESNTYFYWYKYFNGTYALQNIDTTVQNLSSDYTSEGESWKCGVIVNDGYVNSTESISTQIAIGNVDPVIDSATTNSNLTNPLQYGDNVEFTIEWSDANVDEVADIFVCNSTNHNREGCLDTAFCTLSTTGISPFSCEYDTSNFNNNLTNISFFVFLYDLTDKETNSTGNFYINHLPTISSVDLNTTGGSIWPTATDDLNCSEINVSDQDDDNDIFNETGTNVAYKWYYDQGNNFTEYPYDGQVLTAWHTMVGDYWYCTVTPNDGYHDGNSITSNTVYIYDLSINDTSPTITLVTVNSNKTAPTIVGENVTFTIEWNDADLPFGQTVTAYICNANGRWPNGSCKNPYTEVTNVSSTPLITKYTTKETDNSTSNFTVQLVDETGKESYEWNMSSGQSYFAVNHVPNATDVKVIQLGKDLFQCDFTYYNSSYSGGRNDSEINDSQSDENSVFKWYIYQNDYYLDITSIVTTDGKNMTKDPGFPEGVVIQCAIKVADIWNLTDTEFRNSTNLTVLPSPEPPTLWQLDSLTNKNTSQIIGQLIDEGLSNMTVEAWAWQDYETPKTNNTTSIISSTLHGISTVVDAFQENSSFIVISDINQSEFSIGRFIEFSNHNGPYFERYNITDNIEIIPEEQYRINIDPNLITDVPNETTVRVYNSSYPKGWFNITLEVFSGNNIIKARAIKDIDNGEIPGEFSSEQIIFSDSISPEIDISEVPSSISTNAQTINFNVSDNYGLNLSTLLLNISGGSSPIYHRFDNTIYNDSNWTFNQDISCSSINSTSEDCNVVINLTDNDYTLTFTVNDTVGSNGSAEKAITINTSIPNIPTVTRKAEEFNNTNLTFNVSIPFDINETEGIIQFAIGTEVYPNTGWNSILTWIDLTEFTNSSSNISYSNISDSGTNLTIYTGNLSLTPHTIYIANVRYQLYNWSLWSDIGSSLSMKYFPPFTAGIGPNAVNVTAPLYSFSTIIPITWTQSSDDRYAIDYYLITAGNNTYPDPGWNTTTDGWINAGDSLGKTLDLTGNLTHLETYYFTVAAVNTIGVLGTPSYSSGTTYYDQTPPVASIFSVSNDTDSSDGWLDYVEDSQTLINITGDENMTCYYSLYDQDYADEDPTKGDSTCNATGLNTDLNLTCNITNNTNYLSPQPLTQDTYTYYIICQDTLSPTANQQSSEENLAVTFTVNWPDEPEIDNVTIDITDYTDDSNNRNASNLTYALTDDTLFCNYVASDLDGNETINSSLTDYIWYINDNLTENQDTAYLNLSIIGSAGDNITCSVNVTDTTGLSSSFMNSTETIFINNSIPTQSTLLEPENNSFQVQNILFNWTDSTDADDDLINYTLSTYNTTGLNYESSYLIDSNYTLNISNTTDWPDGNYSWYVTTCDNSSFADRCTNSTNNLTFRVDQTSPTINITSPENDESVGILVEFYIDINDTLNDVNNAWYTIVNSSNETVVNGLTGTPFVLLNNSYYFAWSTSAFTTGNYTFFAHANDTLGNYNNESINFTLDLLEPYMEIDTDPWQFRNRWLKDTLFIRVFVNSTNSTFGANYTVTANYTISHQNGTVIKTNSTTNSSASFEWNNTHYVNNSDWPDARYDAVFKSTDTLNNIETIETWFVVDKTPPNYANPTALPSPTYDDDNVTLTIDWLNNVFVWDANENNIDKDSVKIIYTPNTSDTSSYKEFNLSSGLGFLNDTFSAIIPSDETNKSETIFWKSIADDLAGNRNDTANGSNISSEWFNFTIYSTPPVFNQTIQDIEWPEDTDYTNLTLNPLYFYDPDNDNLTYAYTMYPKGILLYDDLNNLTETTNSDLTTIRITLQQNPLTSNVTANSTWTSPIFTLTGNWVSFTQPENFTGNETIYFNISDGETYISSNNITLQVFLNILYNTYIDGANYAGRNHNNTLMKIYQSELYNSNITGTSIIETNATITGNETGPFNTTVNYSLDLTYTNNSVEESCSVIFSQSGTINTDTIILNISQAGCNITATNSSGSLTLTTFSAGTNEYITITGGNATSELGLITGARYNGTSYSRTTIKSSFLNFTNLTNSNATDSSINISDIVNSSLTNCNVRNSFVKNYNASDCIITDSEVDPVNITRNLINSNITDTSYIYDTEIKDSTISNSTINISIITNSTINDTINLFNSTITNSIILNSNISDVTLTDTTVDSSTIDPSNVTNSTITGSSTILNSNVTDSTINNSNVSMSWILGITLVNANVTSNIISSGLIYEGSTLLYNATANGSNSLGNLTNYPPHITGFNFSQESTDNPKVQADVEDENLGGAISDNLTYTIDWGDNSSTTGNITSSGVGFEVDRNHEYSSSENYTATLTVTDSFGKTDIESETLTITSSAGSGGNCSDGIQNQNECSVDNGGVCGGSCSDGGGGRRSSDAPPPTCTDNILNQDETGIDCGGVCAACPSSATCSDGILNQDETGIDCGGSCSACPAATCTDNILNQDEEDIDCGGQCAPCTVTATCTDNILNQDETETDCGGVCPACATCYDGILNQNEEDIDCGGSCSACPEQEQPAVFGIPLNYMPYIFGSFIALVAILGLLLRLRSKPPKKPEQIITREEKLIPIEKPISPEKEQEKPIEPIKPKIGEDKFKTLKEYIRVRLSHGFDKAHIKQALLIKGWPEEVLDVALDGSRELASKLSEVEGYVQSSSSEGYTLENIRDSLIDQGWSEGITDLLLFSCHKPHTDKEKLKGYINYKLAQGRKPEEIKQILTSIGWNDEVINSII